MASDDRGTKALFGGAGAVLSALIAGLTDGHLTAVECLVALAAGLAAAQTVYIVPNKKKRGATSSANR